MAESQPLPKLEDKVSFLSKADAYTGYRGQVAAVETHMSWVFLTDRRAYKLKKPSVRTLVDLGSPEARYQNCQEEVRLNRQLGGDTYLGVEPLSLSPGGRLQLGRAGVPVDWLVVMRRIPEAAFLEVQIKAGRVDYVALERAAELLSSFYQQTEAIDLTSTQYRHRFDQGIRENHRSLCAYPLPREWLECLRDRQLAFLEQQPSRLGERARQQMILEAHGDLRPEHLCLTDPPAVIDCLEFNRDLRILDRADELAFLAMECERLGNSRVGDILLNRYTKRSGDQLPLSLLAFYKCYRACIRAKLCVWHLDDDPDQRRGRWLEKAQSYLQMAERYTEHFVS